MTPLLAFQADSTHVSYSSDSIAAINSMASNPEIGVLSDIRSAYHRFLATAGLELRFPLLFSSTSASHVIEPMAQLFARNDEAYSDTLGIPNEDAQSFVFDATTLFERDKFSGYDRVEGGTRGNFGLPLFRRLRQWLDGERAGRPVLSSRRRELVRLSRSRQCRAHLPGLETETSDFVGLFGFATPSGISASLSARLDEQTLEMRRGELKAGYSTDALSLTAKYAFIQAQPLYGFPEDRRELSVGASARIHENWRVFGSGTYDFETDVMVKNALGFAYDDECFTYLMTFSETRDAETQGALRKASGSTCLSGRLAISDQPRVTSPAFDGRQADIVSPHSEGMESANIQE